MVKTLDEFDECVREWKSMDRSTDDERNQASEFYDNKVFPFIKDVFLGKPENCRPEGKEYGGLILTVGLSPEPLILSICALKPTQLSLLYTQETEKFLQRIEKEALAIGITAVSKHEIGGSDVVEIYEIVKKQYDDWEIHPDKLAVDITGGKTSMAAGAAMAGCVLGADIYYVDSGEFLPEFRKPAPGTEYLNLLANPYVVFER